MALSRFWNWLRSCWHSTTMPVGRWIRRAAEEVLSHVLSTRAGGAERLHLHVCRVELDVHRLHLGAPPQWR